MQKVCLRRKLRLAAFFLNHLLCFLGAFAVAQTGSSETPSTYLTAQEVLAHFEGDEATKRTFVVVIKPHREPLFISAIRSLVNRDWWQDREMRFAKDVSFETPLLVRSPLMIDDSLIAEATPLIEQNAMALTQRDLKDYADKQKLYKERLETGEFSDEDYDFLLDRLHEEFARGSEEKLYKQNLDFALGVARGNFNAYYLTPVLYKGEFHGYMSVDAERAKNFSKTVSGWRRPLSYPLQVSSQEAKTIAGETSEPGLTDLSAVRTSLTAESLFWLFDTEVVGAMTGAHYRMVDAEGEAVNPFNVRAEVKPGGMMGGAPWFSLVLPLRLEPLAPARYDWNSALKPINLGAQTPSWQNFLLYYALFALFVVIVLALRARYDPNF